MKRTLTAIMALSVIALAAPASAQMVNGFSRPGYNHDSPIGTKGISSSDSQGEKSAIAGAIQNEMDAKAMQRTSGPTTVMVATSAPVMRSRTAARPSFRPSRSNDLTGENSRLTLHSD